MTSIYYEEVRNAAEERARQKKPFSVSGVLKKLGVSRSGFRSYIRHRMSRTEEYRELMKEKIIDIFDDSMQNYGAPKIARLLRKQGFRIAERTVGKYMSQLGIHAQWIKHFTTTTQDSDFSCKLKNILGQQFNPDKPNAVWVTDITYIWTTRGFVYLNCVMDLFSRKIIAWTLADSLEVCTVLETIRKARSLRKTDEPVIIHSDRGSQYVSADWRKATSGMIRSYSQKGYPYDNACIESFHSVIKREWLTRFSIQDIEHARTLIFAYIDAFYNTRRIHSHCEYMSPNDYEKQYAEELQALAAEASVA